MYHTDILAAGVETPSPHLHLTVVGLATCAQPTLPRRDTPRVEWFCGLSLPAPRGTRGPRSHPRKPARADSSIRDAGRRRDAVVERAHRHVSGVVAFLLRGTPKCFLENVGTRPFVGTQSDGFEARPQIHEFKNSSAGRSFKMLNWPRWRVISSATASDRRRTSIVSRRRQGLSTSSRSSDAIGEAHRTSSASVRHPHWTANSSPFSNAGAQIER